MGKLTYVPSWLDGATTLLQKINKCIERIENLTIDAVVPTIGLNGNWYIQGHDTGFSSKGTPASHYIHTITLTYANGSIRGYSMIRLLNRSSTQLTKTDLQNPNIASNVIEAVCGFNGTFYTAKSISTTASNIQFNTIDNQEVTPYLWSDISVVDSIGLI